MHIAIQHFEWCNESLTAIPVQNVPFDAPLNLLVDIGSS